MSGNLRSAAVTCHLPLQIPPALLQPLDFALLLDDSEVVHPNLGMHQAHGSQLPAAPGGPVIDLPVLSQSYRTV